jgi:phosphoribosylformylglycinamidine cyclo-ligase
VLLVPPAQVESALSWFKSQDIGVYIIGKVIEGTGEVIGLPQ